MGSTKEIKTNELIESAITNLYDSVILDKSVAFDDVKSIIRVFMRKHPEIFWFSHQYNYDETTGILMLKYNFTKEKSDFFKGEIEKVLKYDFRIDHVATLSEPERVVYVYKWIANRTTYNEYSSFNQTIYSVLVNRNSVCTGYAKTAQYLLGQMGVESRLVFGKFHSDTTQHGRHCWNIVKIDNKWYHVDFCQADVSLKYLLSDDETLIEKDSLLWNYYGVTTDKILNNRSIEFIETIPPCTDSISDIPDVELLAPEGQLICCKSDSGASAKVYLNSLNKNTVIKVPRDGSKELIAHEAGLLSRLSGRRHIVESYGLNANGLELEQLMPWGELLNSHYYNPNECELENILRQLVEGLIECRDKGITYSDIHYNNVLVTKDGTYKWGDFGIAFPKQADGRLPAGMLDDRGKAKGSYWFMAPETYLHNVFTEASAIYSLAMIAYFVMNDMRPPFWTNDENKEDALTLRLNGKDIPAPSLSNTYKDLWSKLRHALPFPENERPQTFEDFLRLLDDDMAPIVGCEACNQAIPELCTVGCISEEFASTSGGRFLSVDNYDDDLFARTAAFPVKTAVHRQSEQNDSYAPQKKAKGIKFKRSVTNPWLLFWRDSNNRYETEPDYGSDISACVYAPAQIQVNKTFIIRVFLYRPEETEKVDAKVKSIDPKAQKKEYKPLDIPVEEGDKLTVQLKMSDGVTLDTDTKTVVWHNHFTDCSFMAKLKHSPVDDIFETETDDVYGTAYVSVNGIPAGELLFTIDVVDSSAKNLYAKVEVNRYSRIFISYSHQDEMQVRGFAECCRALGKDYFFDRHTLQAGDIFKDKILDYINNADLFVLCWSKNAAESEWVQIEREHALSLVREGNGKPTIYPLCLKPEAPLPIEMADKYNFGKL